MVERRGAWRSVASVGLAVAMFGAGAWADPPEADHGAPEPAAARGAESAERGVFLPFGLPARNDAQRAYVWAAGGYDASRGGITFDATAQVRLAGPVGLRGGAGYVGPDGRLRPSFALSVQALRQSDVGVDLSLYGGFQAQGFNTVPALNLSAAVGRTFGRLLLLANVGYGLGLEAGESYGEARLAAQVRLAPSLRLGLDGRVRVDLERDDDEPAGEPDWELVAGPTLAWSVDRFTLGLSGGLAATQLRGSDVIRLGAQGQLLVGASF